MVTGGIIGLTLVSWFSGITSVAGTGKIIMCQTAIPLTRSPLGRWLFRLGLLLIALIAAGICGAGEKSPVSAFDVAEEKKTCLENLAPDTIRRLKRMSGIIGNCRTGYRTWCQSPFQDIRVLVCPVSRRTGRTVASPLGNPKFPVPTYTSFARWNWGNWHLRHPGKPAASGGAGRRACWDPLCRWCVAGITVKR